MPQTLSSTSNGLLVPTTASPPRTPPPATARGLSVLVVGGSPTDTERLTLILEATGCDVATTPGGLAAADLAYLAQPDVVILATDTANECELAREILGRAGWRRPFLVALTERGDAEAARWFREAGVHLTAERPVDPDLLCGLLRRFRSLLVGIEGFDPAI
ncbi:MAG: hypothetical protein JWO38_4714 [Gemmataceae bacterium]|nr:hypothetical protein [Gemmataceae bacterium]